MYYDRLTVPFSDADFTKVKRIEGWAIQAPSNKNFGALIVADRDIQVVPGQATNRVCESNCFIQCKCGQDVCRELVCPAVCTGEEKQFDSAELPVCWQVGFDVELTRRGFGVEAGDQLTVTGPVVDNYDIQIWVQDIGQIEILSEN